MNFKIFMYIYFYQPYLLKIIISGNNLGVFSLDLGTEEHKVVYLFLSERVLYDKDFHENMSEGKSTLKSPNPADMIRPYIGRPMQVY